MREQIALLQQLRSTWKGADARALLRMQALYAQFYGGLHLDTGEHHLAQSWVDRALSLAQMAGDNDLAVYILACRADLSGYSGESVDVIGAGERALSLAPPRSRTAVVSAMFTGHGYALSGDRTAMERCYAQAHEVFGTLDADPDCPCGTWWLDETRITLQRAKSLAVLGDHHSAVQSFQVALPTIPSRCRSSRGVWLARAALASARDRDVDQAVTMGLEALAIATETRSAKIRTELLRLNEALAPWHNLPAVTDFRTAMTETLSVPA